MTSSRSPESPGFRILVQVKYQDLKTNKFTFIDPAWYNFLSI